MLRNLLRAHEGGMAARQTRHHLVGVLAASAAVLWCVVEWPAFLPPVARSLLLAACAVVFLLLLGVSGQEWLWYRERLRCERTLAQRSSRDGE